MNIADQLAIAYLNSPVAPATSVTLSRLISVATVSARATLAESEKRS